MRDDTQATLEGSTFKNGTYALYLSNNASLMMRGGSIQGLGSGDCGAGVGVYVPGSSSNQEQQTVNLESVFMQNIHGNAISVSSRATVTLKNADIRSSGQKSCGNSTNLEVSNPDAVFTLENSSISNSLGNGLVVYDGQITVKNSYFSSNANSGLMVLKGTANIEASEFRGNQIGLYFGGVGKVRGSSFQYNKTGLYASSAVDLGTVGQPGNNTFTLNTDYGVRVGSSSALTMMAVGNTWIANEQGADSQGKYASQLFTGPITGKNYVLENANQKVQF
jgi:hypothetical protein